MGIVRAALTATVLLASAGAIGRARADDAADRKARAAQLVEAATVAQRAADYPTAIARLRAAYDLIPHPDLLYNLGQAYRLGDQPWDAIEQYERYLAVEPKGSFARTARQHLAALRKATKGQVRPAEPVVAPPPPRAPTRVTPPPPLDLPPPPPPARAQPPITTWRRPVALGLAVVGLAGVGAGSYFGLQARSISVELTNHDGPWTDALLDKQAQGQTAETRAIIGLAAGGALVVGGVVLFALDQRGRARADDVAVVPTLSPSTVGLAVRGAL